MSRLPEKLRQPRAIVSAAILALVTAGAASAFAWAHDARDAQAMTIDAMSNPTDLADHVARMSEHLYAEVGATDAQKAQLDPIFSQAASDFAALHGQLGSGHAEAMQLLTQDPIDRAALESFRAEHMRVADEASRRMVQLLADVAEVLTPAQRKRLVDSLNTHHGGHMGMGWHHG
jgi:Spy/CpxP family protein refolding chaperone